MKICTRNEMQKDETDKTINDAYKEYQKIRVGNDTRQKEKKQKQKDDAYMNVLVIVWDGKTK